MLTRHEARQRCDVNNCDLHFDPVNREYKVVPRWLTGKARKDATYYTDCIEDATLTSGAMYAKSA